MKLIDAIKEHGNPFNVPDCSRDNLSDFLVKIGFKTGAEIGVYKAEFTEKFAKLGLKMYAIDPWLPYEGQTQERQDFLYGHAQRVLAPYPNCTIIRKTSMEALSEFTDGSLDFVYIDGDHRFRYVAEDLAEWYLKVKRDGIVAGHDYLCTDPTTDPLPEVGPVIDAFIKIYGIENFYTFGRSKPLAEEKKDDKYLSWMFFKP